MTTYQLYKAFTTSLNAGAQTQIIKAGRIIGVQWCVPFVGDNGSGEGFHLELSLVPTFQGTTNEAKGVVSIVGANLLLTTSGGEVGGINEFFPTDVPVQAGQLVYLNYAIIGSAMLSVPATALVQVR